MSRRFEWRATRTEYRDLLASSRGEELRWLVNREIIHDTVTGHTVTRSIIRHPGICVVAPFLDRSRIILVRQYRYPLDGELWELPAGTLAGREVDGRVAPAESAGACAARELVEETGYEAAHWEKIAEWYAMPGGNDQVSHLFFARGLAKRAQALEDGELIHEVRAFLADELVRMIERREIRDAKTLVGLFYALAGRPGGVQIV